MLTGDCEMGESTESRTLEDARGIMGVRRGEERTVCECVRRCTLTHPRWDHLPSSVIDTFERQKHVEVWMQARRDSVSSCGSGHSLSSVRETDFTTKDPVLMDAVADQKLGVYSSPRNM